MLINKGFSQGDILSFKLISGEEIIARLEEDTGETFKISKPVVVVLQGRGAGTMPWVLLGEDSVLELKKLHCFAVMPTKKEAADQYLENTTGIALQ
jgi:hypothetical protein